MKADRPRHRLAWVLCMEVKASGDHWQSLQRLRFDSWQRAAALAWGPNAFGHHQIALSWQVC